MALSQVSCEDKSIDFASPRSLGNAIGSRTTARLDRALFVCLCVIAFSAPQYINLTTFAFAIALLLWLSKLLIRGREYPSPPLVLPSLLFLVTAGVASALSFAPLLSWERIGSYALLPLAFVVAQNVKTSWQLKILVFLVLLSGTLSALRTGWQYAYGIGTRLVAVPPDSLLFRDGIRSGDLIQLVNRHKTRSLQQWKSALELTHADRSLKLHVARQAPIAPLTTYFDFVIERKDLEQWLSLPESKVQRGRPQRATGHLDHFVRYAGVMTLLASLAFGLLVTIPTNRSRFILGVVFILLVAALFATVTRAYIIGLFLGCALQVWLIQRRLRTTAILGLGLCVMVTIVWVRKERGPVWLSAGDQYRVAMWKDALKIIPHHPFFGVGPDSVDQYGEQWHIRAFREFNFRAHFHSTYVQLAVDCGLPCLAAWLWLLGGYLSFLNRSQKESQPWEPFARGTLLGIFAGTIIFVVASAVNYTLADSEVVAVAWLFMGMVIALARIQKAQAHRDRNQLIVNAV